MAGTRQNPEQAAALWAQRLSGAGERITQGVNRVTEAPGAKAAQKKQKYLAGVQASADKWATRVAAVSLPDWQRAMTEVGIQRISQGAQAKVGKYADFARDFFPHLEAGLAKLANMPDSTQEERIMKSVALMRHNATFKRTR